MATGVSATDPLIEQIENFLRAPGGAGNLGSGVEGVASAMLADAEVAAGGIEVGTEAASTAAIIDGFIDLGGWAILLVVVALAASLKILQGTLHALGDWIPFGIGSRWGQLVDWLFHPLNALEGWIKDRAGEVAGKLVSGFVAMVGGALHILSPAASQHTTVVRTTDLTSVWRAIQELQATVLAQETHIRNLEAHVYGTHAATTINTTLESRVARLENLLTVVSHDLNLLHGNTVGLDHAVQQMQSELAQLEQSLGGVRAVQFGVEEVLRSVEQMTANIQQEYNRLDTETIAQGHQLHQLAPLAALLYLGTPGIKNLQKLEANPCQCPTLARVSGLTYDALILDQALLNGI